MSAKHDLGAVADDLAPGGTLRAAINFGNPVLAQRHPGSGEPKGVSVAIAQEIGRRLNLPLRFVTFDAAGKVFAALAQDAWDVAFLAIDPERAMQIDFSAPYAIIEGSYMVRTDSALRSIGELDRPGTRIAVGAGSAYDLFLGRTIRHATLVRAPTGAAAISLFLQDRLDAVAGVRSPLERFARDHPDLRVIDGRFMAIEQAIAVPKGRHGALEWMQAFLRDLKQSGFIADALRDTGQADAIVASP